jgi:hypothetical protein
MFTPFLIAAHVEILLLLKRHRALATANHFQRFITQLAHD